MVCLLNTVLVLHKLEVNTNQEKASKLSGIITGSAVYHLHDSNTTRKKQGLVLTKQREPTAKY